MEFEKKLIDKLSFKITKSDFERSKKGIFCNILDIILIYVFEDASIDHKERLIRLEEIKFLAKHEKIRSSHAYSLVLSSAVLKELGQNNLAIKNTLKSIKVFKTVDDEYFANSGLSLDVLTKKHNVDIFTPIAFREKYLL